MKYRDYKDFRLGHYYHIYNRGNNKEVIFFDISDFVAFMLRLRVVLGLVPCPKGLYIRALHKNQFKILIYCLMPNHFHFVIQQQSEVPIGVLLKKVCTSYSIYFNKKYNRVGRVFQDIFKAKLIPTDEYLVYVSRYIHRNPDSNILIYPYSSLQEYIAKSDICDTTIILKYFNDNPQDYLNYVKGPSFEG